MFKKGLVTLVCLIVMSAVWSWATATYTVMTEISSLGTKLNTATGVYEPVKGGSIKTRATDADPGVFIIALQELTIPKGSTVTEDKDVEVQIAAYTDYKIASVVKTSKEIVGGVETEVNQTLVSASENLKTKNITVSKPAIANRTQTVKVTFTADTTSDVIKRTWQLQANNNNGGGSFTLTRAGVVTPYTTVGKPLVKNYIDTTPVTVNAASNAGWTIDYVVINGVKDNTDRKTFSMTVSGNPLRLNTFNFGYKKDSIQVTTHTATYVDANGVTKFVDNGILPINPVADPYGVVRLVISPVGSQNQVTAVNATGGTVTLTDRFGDPLPNGLPFTGAVKVTIKGITAPITVTTSYGTDPAASAQYVSCTQTCHLDSALAPTVKAAATNWLTSSHRSGNVDCVSCHTTMPGPDLSTTGAKEALCASCHVAGATPTTAHTAAHNVCSTCHTFGDMHAPVEAPVVGTVAAQHPADLECARCHVDGGATLETVSFNSPGTPDVVDAGDSYLPAPAEFAGSNACRACHANHFEGWTKSLHNKPTKYFANQGEGILVNDQDSDGINDFAEGIDFNDASFATTYGYANPFATQAAAGVAPILKKVGADFVIQIGATEYKINRTQGGNGYWKQRFYTEVGGGNYVLPVQWNEVQKRYSVYNAQYWYNGTTPRFNQAYGSAELLAAFKAAYAAGGDGPASSSWENRCAGCHQSGLTVKVQDGEVVSGYADMNVGCEACHGPAAAHAANPTKANIVNPNDYLSQTGGAYKAVETCGKCHQRGESKQYLGAGETKAAAGTVGSIQKKVEAPAKLSADLSTAIFFPMGGDLFGGGWYTDNVGIFGTKTTMTYNGYSNFPAYVASNQHHQQWEDLEQGKHGATYAESTPGAQKMACWSCHDLHSPKGSHNTRSKLTVGGTTLTGLSATNNTLCLACHAGKGKFAALTLGSLQADPTGADVVAAVNAHVSARIPGKTITAANYLVGGRKDGGSSRYGIIEYLNGQCVACHMPLAPSSTGVRIYMDALNKGQGDQHSHTMKTILKPAGTSITSCSGCHGDFTDFVAEKLAAKKVEGGQTATGVTAVAGFVGTNACQSCHLGQFAEYTDTLHNKPLKTIAVLGEGVVLNDSNNNGINDFKDGLNFNTVSDNSIFQTGANVWASQITAGDFAPILSYEANKYFITIGAVKYEIVRTQGGNGKWKQRYHTKIGEGYYVLPVQFNEISKKYEAYNNTNWYKPNNTPWVTAGASNTDVATVAQVATLLTTKGLKTEYPGFAGTGNQGTSTSSWDNRCSACHQTGVNIQYKDYNGIMQVVSSSADLNIGCESCHGGGANHLKNPYAAGSIVNPAKFSNKYRANEVCGQCHSRTEGFAHFSSAAGVVFAGVEAPSLKADADNKQAKSYVLGDKLLDYIYKVLPNAWKPNGTSGNSGLTAVAYDGATGKFVNGVAANGHHQQWHDLDSGPHGAAKGITCFSCHDPHKKTSGNIRTSKKMGEVTVATKTSDNSLCLSCHAGSGVFSAVTAADVAGIAAAPNSDVVMEAVYAHLVARAGYSADQAKKDSWKSKYLQSVQANGNSATFGIAVYRVGECVSCHMPYSSKSGVHTSTNANGRPQGDQRAHTMKTLWSGLNDLTAAKGLTSATAPTSCSACHPVTLTP